MRQSCTRFESGQLSSSEAALGEYVKALVAVDRLDTSSLIRTLQARLHALAGRCTSLFNATACAQVSATDRGGGLQQLSLPACQPATSLKPEKLHF